jgi:GT2 family glycosyltransferase
MAEFRYTVIIPMRQYRADEYALQGLRENPPPAPAQILVVEGNHPSRQRNAALDKARGELVIFLDNDCLVGSGFWTELEAAFIRPGVQIVGGPALLRSDATALEQIFQTLLTHTLIVGTIASRYSARGEFREARQTELILCNLTAHRSIFQRIGVLSAQLYPNEENEWLDRAHAAGVGAFYDPQLQVFRPQRATLGQLVITLLRYGMGRTRQFKVSGWHPTFHQFLPLMVVVTFWALFALHLECAFVVLWLLASVIIALTCDAKLRPWQRIVAGLTAPLVPLTYSVGQLIGWVALLFPAPKLSAPITVRDERGEVVA